MMKWLIIGKRLLLIQIEFHVWNNNDYYTVSYALAQSNLHNKYKN